MARMRVATALLLLLGTAGCASEPLAGAHAFEVDPSRPREAYALVWGGGAGDSVLQLTSVDGQRLRSRKGPGTALALAPGGHTIRAQVMQRGFTYDLVRTAEVLGGHSYVVSYIDAGQGRSGALSVVDKGAKDCRVVQDPVSFTSGNFVDCH
jgi:hypothetical protein